MLQDQLRSMRKFYYSSPPWLKKMLGAGYRQLPEKWVLGNAYRSFWQLLEDSQVWSKQTFEDYQFEQLKNTLELVYSKIPFYRSRYELHGVTPHQFKSVDDIRLFPTLTKADVKTHLESMTNSDYPAWQRLTTTTGGSTSEPMRFYQLKGLTRSKEKAFIGSGWQRAGYHYGMRAVQFKGRPVAEPKQNRFWVYEPIQNILEMDSSYLSDEHMAAYYQALINFQPEVMIGFPSSIYLLAKHLEAHGYVLPKMKAVLLASENVYPWQRDYLKRIFECPIFSHYGHSEMVLLGMQAEDNADLLFFPQYGHLELLDAQGKSALPNQMGELVGTSFHNPVMPLIRYKTQDLGMLGKAHPNYPHYPVLSKIEGRLQEFLITRDGRGISVCTMGAAHFNCLDKVLETQYVQYIPGEFEFHIVPKWPLTSTDLEVLRQDLQHKTGRDLTVKIKIVDRIVKSRAGKHLMLIQKIEHPNFNFDLDQSYETSITKSS